MGPIVKPSGDVMQRSTPHSTHPVRESRTLASRPLRLLVATAVLALAGGLVQTAMAAPHGPHGGHGEHGAMSALGGMGAMATAHPRQMERMFESIGASAEQRVQIKQIMENAWPENFHKMQCSMEIGVKSWGAMEAYVPKT
jgi:hypothetical protein